VRVFRPTIFQICPTRVQTSERSEIPLDERPDHDLVERLPGEAGPLEFLVVVCEQSIRDRPARDRRAIADVSKQAGVGKELQRTPSPARVARNPPPESATAILTPSVWGMGIRGGSGRSTA
jgi:hypothetical protein